MPVTGKGRRHFSELQHSRDIEGLDCLMQAMKDPQAVPWTEKMRLRPQDTTELLSKAANGPQRESKKALLILARLLGITISTLCLALKTSPAKLSVDTGRSSTMREQKAFSESVRDVYQKQRMKQ